MSKHTVLITSALYTNYGIYNPQERIQQTIATAQSVRKYLPDATIVLIDNSKVDVQNDNSPEINQLIDLVDYYIDNSDDADIQYFHNNVSNYDVGKNSMEVLGFIKALQHIASDPEMSEVISQSNRIFKLSGRYELTEKFDINAFDNKETKDCYVFKHIQQAWCDPGVTEVAFMLQTRLWSFTPSLLNQTIEMFQKIIQNMFDVYNKQQYIDIEHSIYKYMDHPKLKTIDIVGLKGNIAPNGMIILD